MQRPLSVIIRQPRYIVAVVCGAIAQALMNFVMTAAPLAMVQCGHSIVDATLGIQWHAIAMFAPSFFTGTLIQRFGKERMVIAGMMILISCGVVNDGNHGRAFLGRADPARAWLELRLHRRDIDGHRLPFASGAGAGTRLQ